MTRQASAPAELLLNAQVEKVGVPPPTDTAPPVPARYEKKSTDVDMTAERTRGCVAGEGAVRKAGSAVADIDSTIVYSM
jgi:hypothetical protein